MPHIPLANLPAKPADVTESVGYVYAFGCTAPVILTRAAQWVTLRLNPDAETLGMELLDISRSITRRQLERLLKKETVTL